MMNKNIERLNQQICNTLDLLRRQGIMCIYREPVMSIENGLNILSWEGHQSGRFNAGKAFTTIDQYRQICKNGAYHGILNDGSLIRVTFTFDKNILCKESLLFWPSPIPMDAELISSMGIGLAIDSYLMENIPLKSLRMRTPFRYDYDYDSVKIGHPLFHLHMQNNECRMMAKGPLCFNSFIKLILTHFYPQVEFNYNFLSPMHFTYKGQVEENQYPFLCVQVQHK